MVSSSLSCGADYHQVNELNVWVPLTHAYGSNTLWAESEPQRGDFRPFVMAPGEAVLFWGHQCQHYTVSSDGD